MRLYTLNLVGIGPFADPVSIDFRAFDDAGLFLLRGSTGSGKTTLLDAIVFALYGDVTKEGKNSEERLRSHYLSDKERAEVELIFGAQSGIYKVIREPSYQKEGRSSRTPAKATLTRVTIATDGSFIHEKEVASGARQVNQELLALLGLSREQFLQTVILPQGRFAEFLSANSQDRQQILQSIFGTERFEMYQNALIQRGRAAEEALAAHSAKVDAAYSLAAQSYEAAVTGIAELTQESSDFPADVFGVFPEEAALGDSRQRLEKSFDVVEDYCVSRKESTLIEWTNAQEADDQAQELLRFSQEKHELLTTRQRLLQAEDDIARLEQRVRHAQRVAPLSDPLSHARDAWQSLTSTHTEVLSSLQANDSLQPVWASQDSHSSVPVTSEDITVFIAEARRSTAEEKGRLTPLVELEKALTVTKQRLKSDRQGLDKRQEDLTCLRTELKSLPEQISKATTAHNDAYLASQGLKSAQEQENALKRRLAAAQQAESERGTLAQHEDAYQKALDEARAAHSHAEALRSAWLTDSAATLAAELREGEACSVCGSTSHPHKAQPQGDSEPVSRAMVESAQEASHSADETVEDKRQKLNDARQNIETLQALAEGTVETLTELHLAAAAQVKAVKEASESLPTLHKQKTTLERKLSSLQDTINAEERQIAADEASLAEATKLFTAQNAEVAQARGDWPCLSARLDQCKERLELLDEAHQHVSRLHSSIEVWTNASARLSEVFDVLSPDLPLEWAAQPWFCLGSPLPTGEFPREILPHLASVEASRVLEELSVLLLSPSEVDTLSRQVVTHQNEKKTTEEALTQDKYSQLTGDEEARAQASSAAVQEAQQAHQKALEIHSKISAFVEAAQRSLDTYHQRCIERDKAQEGSEAILRLSALASGKSSANLAGIPLSTWVLMSLFDEVLTAANNHLRGISNGRYELIRQSHGTDKRTRHGLDLMVVDYDVDRARYPSTLSGGETFYVSLSLALGLAEIVTGENGGMQLRSMFIDEGFGTLDPHTLDAVMEVLHDLHQDDRLIGIISHVDDLDKRIPEQIIVTRKEKTGSTITIRA